MARGLPLWFTGGETSALAETVLALCDVWAGGRSLVSSARHSGRCRDFRPEASHEFRRWRMRQRLPGRDAVHALPRRKARPVRAAHRGERARARQPKGITTGGPSASKVTRLHSGRDPRRSGGTEKPETVERTGAGISPKAVPKKIGKERKMAQPRNRGEKKSPSRNRKPEGSTLSGYARNLRKESAGLVAGQAVLTAENKGGLNASQLDHCPVHRLTGIRLLD
jgi:hypothetical protein